MRGLLIIPALVAVALCYVALDEASGLRTWLDQRAELGRSDQRIARLESEIERLKIDLERLKGDPFAIERAIREDLQLARAGETVVRMDPPDRHKSANSLTKLARRAILARP